MRITPILLVLLAGCATAPDALADIKAAQRRLGATVPAIAHEYNRYEKAVEKQVQHCRDIRADGPVQRDKCLGIYAEGAPLWDAYEDLRTSYNAAALALESARGALETVEAFTREEEGEE